MKLRNIVLAIAAAAVAGVNVYNAVSGKQAKLSDLQMENVEMLAVGESMGGGGGGGRYNTNYCGGRFGSKGRLDFKWVPAVTACNWTDGDFMLCL